MRREEPLSVRHTSTMTVIFGAVLLCFLWGALYFKVQSERQTELDHAVKETANYARAFAEHTERTLRGLDEMALFLKYQAETGGLPKDLTYLVSERRFAGQPVRIFGMLNPDGELVSSSIMPFTPTNGSDREMFTVHKNATTGKLYLGKPLMGRTSRAITIQMSRRVNRPDGSFGGVVFIGVDPGYFTEFYKKIDLGEKSAIIMVGLDGVVRAQQPNGQSDLGIDSGRMQKLAEESGGGTIIAQEQADKSTRILSYRRLEDYPLAVWVGTTEEYAFKDLNQRIAGYYGIGGTMSGVIVLFVALLLYGGKRRTQAEKTMRESEEFLHRLMDAIPVPVFYKNPAGRYIGFNKAFEQFHGVDQQTMIGHTSSDLFPEDQARTFQQIDAELVQQPGVKIYGSQIKTASGSIQDVVIHKASFAGMDNRVRTIIGVIIDVTEKLKAEREREKLLATLELRVAGRTAKLAAANKDLEEINREILMLSEHLERLRSEAEAASRAKSRFIANMSHELRTPMHIILGMSHALGQTGLSREQQKTLEMIQGAGQSLLNLINNILEFAKSEDAKPELAEETFHLDELLRQSLAAVRLKAIEKGLALTWEKDEKVPEVLTGGYTQLRQVLHHLLGNAVKFTESGKITVQAAVDEAAENQIKLHFSVQDTGIGISDEDSQKLFQSFSQIDDSSTRRYGGTGLGLAIARRLVALMGGRIWLESLPGQGSTFHFTARFSVGSEETASKPKASETVELLPSVPSDETADNQENPAAMQQAVCTSSAEMLLHRLRESLAAYDSEAVELWEEVSRSGCLQASPQKIAALRQNIGQFNFAAALAILNEIMPNETPDSKKAAD